MNISSLLCYRSLFPAAVQACVCQGSPSMCVSACAYAHTRAPICIYIYVHARTRVHIYIYIHIYKIYGSPWRSRSLCISMHMSISPSACTPSGSFAPGFLVIVDGGWWCFLFCFSVCASCPPPAPPHPLPRHCRARPFPAHCAENLLVLLVLLLLRSLAKYLSFSRCLRSRACVCACACVCLDVVLSIVGMRPGGGGRYISLPYEMCFHSASFPPTPPSAPSFLFKPATLLGRSISQPHFSRKRDERRVSREEKRKGG